MEIDKEDKEITLFELQSMKLHENKSISSFVGDAGYYVNIMRVPGGWWYTSTIIDEARTPETMDSISETSIFVPYTSGRT